MSSWGGLALFTLEAPPAGIRIRIIPTGSPKRGVGSTLHFVDVGVDTDMGEGMKAKKHSGCRWISPSHPRISVTIIISIHRQYIAIRSLDVIRSTQAAFNIHSVPPRVFLGGRVLPTADVVRTTPDSTILFYYTWTGLVRQYTSLWVSKIRKIRDSRCVSVSAWVEGISDGDIARHWSIQTHVHDNRRTLASIANRKMPSRRHDEGSRREKPHTERRWNVRGGDCDTVCVRTILLVLMFHRFDLLSLHHVGAQIRNAEDGRRDKIRGSPLDETSTNLRDITKVTSQYQIGSEKIWMRAIKTKRQDRGMP
ncbi:hypothetical protein GALMADRAFT_277707 [Galerina marginata CBS 339.88]|uniref:Uncharacterized protein n=1 Tax=Galerina marginata (strain CBS 339.88) TaxID=685588 RepID=A0A067TA10_GALM3|nr:hypothetical protein GALMADRAFT_277707 [Galerina marginata CBS 339.88]